MKVVSGLLMILAVNHILACCWYGLGRWTSGHKLACPQALIPLASVFTDSVALGGFLQVDIHLSVFTLPASVSTRTLENGQSWLINAGIEEARMQVTG